MPLARTLTAALVVLIVVLVGAGPTADADAPEVRPDGVAGGPDARLHESADGPLLSALVQLASPSVYDVFARSAGAEVPAGMVRPLARKFGEQLRRADRAAASAQAPIVTRAEALGIRVVSRYTAAANGLLVHGTSGQLAELSATAGVARIEPAPRVKPSLHRSVPRIGAEEVAASLGYTGTGTVVAIVDTGIDYTHASFGGPGNPAVYEQASQEAETIDDKWLGLRMYPNDVVVGGWDFVGPNYTHPELCPPEREAAGECTSTPHPDPDPLDQHGHGTHVASAAAGRPVEGVSRGVAPGATLLALKVYGPPRNHGDTDETIDVLVDAIDWCVRVNLGLSVPGVPPPAPSVIHVVNMSLGEPYAQGSKLVDEAFEAAAGAGMVLVAAGGNDGNSPYIVSAPGASPSSLSVAAASLGETDEGDLMAGFSARGPSKNGALKPDLTAPGPVMTARYGSGTGASSSSGTSLSAPHVAGAAALVFERDRENDLGLTASDMSAMLMNTARPMPSGAGPVPVVRQGAGRLDVGRAASTQLVVRTGDIASLNIGALALTRGETLNRRLDVQNLSDETMFLKADPRFRVEEDADAGVAVSVPEGPIEVPAGGSVELPVSFSIEHSELRSWSGLGTTPPFEAGVVDLLEIDGAIALIPVGADGVPTDKGVDLSVPFYVLPRAASDIRVVDGQAGSLRLQNESGITGNADVYVVPDGGRHDDPDEPDVVGELDVRQVGVRYDAGGRTVTFGVALHDAAVVPHLTQLELYLDVDLDQVVDYRVRAGGVSYDVGDTVVAVGAWDDESGSLIGDEQIVGDGTYRLHSRVLSIEVPLSAIGIGTGAPFDFYVVHRGLTEDWWGLRQTDAVPDGYAGPCGKARLRVRPDEWRGLPIRWSVDEVGGEPVDVDRSEGSGSRTPALLVLFPDNRFEDESAASVVIEGADPEPLGAGGVCHAFLPMAVRGHELLPLDPPDAMIADAFVVMEPVVYSKLKWDITNKRDSSRDGFSKYHFRSPDGMTYVWSPRVGEVQREYIRVGNEGFIRFVPPNDPGPWACHPVDEDMLFYPEWLVRLRGMAPERGWEIKGQSPFHGRNTWTLRHEADGSEVTYSARVDVETGHLLLLSRTETSPGAQVVRQDVYEFYDFGVENTGMGRPRVPRCP